MFDGKFHCEIHGDFPKALVREFDGKCKGVFKDDRKSNGKCKGKLRGDGNFDGTLPPHLVPRRHPCPCL